VKAGAISQYAAEASYAEKTQFSVGASPAGEKRLKSQG